MSRAEWRAFLLAQSRTAKAATVRPDGRRHIAPVWFDLDDDDVIFTTWHTTVKARDLQRDPRISLCVDAAHNTICDGDADTVQDDRVEPHPIADHLANGSHVGRVVPGGANTWQLALTLDGDDGLWPT